MNDGECAVASFLICAVLAGAIFLHLKPVLEWICGAGTVVAFHAGLIFAKEWQTRRTQCRQR